MVNKQKITGLISSLVSLLNELQQQQPCGGASPTAMSLSEPTLLGNGTTSNSVGSKGEEAHSGHQMGDVIKHLAVATTKVALTCAGSPNALTVP